MSNVRPSAPAPAAGSRRFLLARRNLLILAAARDGTRWRGYATLMAGHPSAAAVILVHRLLRAAFRSASLSRKGVRRHGTVPARAVFDMADACSPSGRIAQLVQSACLTRRMSGVRIPLRPFTSALLSAAIARSCGTAPSGRLSHVSVPSLSPSRLCCGALTAPLGAQGIPRNATRQHDDVAPRVHGRQPVRLRARPIRRRPSRSATGLREEMKGVVGRDFQVVEQTRR